MMALLEVRRRSGRLPFTRRPGMGRHRRGQVLASAERAGSRQRVWDAAQRARAEQLSALEPGWLVIYGPYSRRFHAIARVAGVREPLLDAATPEELRGLMRRSEAAGSASAPRPAGTARVRVTGGGRTRRWP